MSSSKARKRLRKERQDQRARMARPNEPVDIEAIAKAIEDYRKQWPEELLNLTFTPLPPQRLGPIGGESVIIVGDYLDVT